MEIHLMEKNNDFNRVFIDCKNFILCITNGFYSYKCLQTEIRLSPKTKHKQLAYVLLTL